MVGQSLALNLPAMTRGCLRTSRGNLPVSTGSRMGFPGEMTVPCRRGSRDDMPAASGHHPSRCLPVPGWVPRGLPTRPAIPLSSTLSCSTVCRGPSRCLPGAGWDSRGRRPCPVVATAVSSWLPAGPRDARRAPRPLPGAGWDSRGTPVWSPGIALTLPAIPPSRLLSCSTVSRGPSRYLPGTGWAEGQGRKVTIVCMEASSSASYMVIRGKLPGKLRGLPLYVREVLVGRL